MKLLYLGIICSFIAVTVCLSQTDAHHPSTNEMFQQMTEPIPGVSYSVTISNRSFTIGETNILLCRLLNSSTTNIAFFEPADKVAAIFITNSTGSEYILSGPQTPHSTNMAGRVVYVFSTLKAGESKDWAMRFVVGGGVRGETRQRNGRPIFEPVPTGKLVETGDYRLFSTEAYFTADGKYVRGIKSNIIEVTVIK